MSLTRRPAAGRAASQLSQDNPRIPNGNISFRRVPLTPRKNGFDFPVRVTFFMKSWPDIECETTPTMKTRMKTCVHLLAWLVSTSVLATAQTQTAQVQVAFSQRLGPLEIGKMALGQ